MYCIDHQHAPLSRGFEAKYEERNRLIDLFSLYVLFSQFRPRDVLYGICLLYANRMHVDARA